MVIPIFCLVLSLLINNCSYASASPTSTTSSSSATSSASLLFYSPSLSIRQLSGSSTNSLCSPCSHRCREYSDHVSIAFNALTEQAKGLEDLQGSLEQDATDANLHRAASVPHTDPAKLLSQLTLKRDTAQDAQNAHESMQLTARTILNWHGQLAHALASEVELCDEHAKMVRQMKEQASTPHSIAQQTLTKTKEYTNLEEQSQHAEQELEQFLAQSNMQSLDAAPIIGAVPTFAQRAALRKK